MKNERAEIARNVKAVEAAVRAAADAQRATERVYYRIKGERGLLLAVYPKQRRATWLLRYQVGKGANREQRTRDIGAVGVFSLAQACAARAALMAETARGRDPDSPKTFDDLISSLAK